MREREGAWKKEREVREWPAHSIDNPEGYSVDCSLEIAEHMAELGYSLGADNKTEQGHRLTDSEYKKAGLTPN